MIINPYLGYLIVLFVGLLAGWLISRMLNPIVPKDRKEEEKNAYLSGINFLIANEPDKAIEEFTKAVRIDSNTIDTYFTLGSLFRSKGDVGRATRIHQGITLRPFIDDKIKNKALYELGLDFKKAGLLKRAITIFEEVIHKNPSMVEAYEQLESLYEETKEWDKAFDLQTRLLKIKKTKNKNVLAHLQTELGKSFFEKGDIGSAKKAYKKAISLDDTCVDAYLHLGDLYASQLEYEKAVKIWKKVLEITPSFAYFAYPRLEDSYFRLGQFDEMERLLRDISERYPEDCYTHLALARYLYKKHNIDEAIGEIRLALEYNPEFIEARKELGRILIEQDRKDDALEEFRQLLEKLPHPKKPFQCKGCGYEAEDFLWKCPQCQQWDTITPKEVKKKKVAS